MQLRRKLLALWFGLCMLVAALPAQAATRVEMDPVALGIYHVACSNLAIDSEKLNQLGGVIGDYWSGKNGSYVSGILLEPDDTLKISPRIPDEGLYSRWRNSVVDFAIIVCYPTDAANLRPDYVLPDGQIIPKMQRAGQPPILLDIPCIATFPAPPGCGRWPLLAFSHGQGSSPADSRSLDILLRIASNGYIVAAPFHGDDRFLRLQLSDLDDLWYLARNFDEFVALQALRPLAVKSVIDTLLANPDFGNKIDPDRIGGIGASMGGETMTLLLGAQLTNNYLRQTSAATVTDPRIKAAIGYIPYAGQKYLPAFGEDNATVGNVSAPYLAISGADDNVAPMYRMEEALRRFSGTRYQVALNGVGHTYETSYKDDVFGWAVPFFAAYLDGAGLGYEARARLSQQLNIRGGLDDTLRIAYDAPSAWVIEFYNSNLGHFFITADTNEAAAIDDGSAGPGWMRTGNNFKSGGSTSVCRFYGSQSPGPNSHFYTVDAAECAWLKQLQVSTPDTKKRWNFESLDFISTPPANGVCPVGTQPVYRAYNNGYAQGVDSNHRITSSLAAIQEVVMRGWSDEGAVMCAPN